MATPEKLDEHTWETFVLPTVKFKHRPDTRELIKTIMPYFPKECHCIGGYLENDDQFWKVNYHWEYLLMMLRRAVSHGIRVRDVQQLITKTLSNSPNPDSGYMDSKVFTEPHDSSSYDRIRERWHIVSAVKLAFEKILTEERVRTRYGPAQPWNIAVARVAAPGKSMHGQGYALDIEGSGMNARIVEISKGLGSSMTFDEKSHVHVEFKHGVQIGRQLVADNPHDGRYMGWLYPMRPAVQCER